MAYIKKEIVKPIVLVDIDGVLLDFEQGFLNNWKIDYPHLPFIPKDKREIHDIASEYSKFNPDFKTNVDLIIKHTDFFSKIPLIENANGILDKLEQKGYEVFLCTTPLKNTDNLIGKQLIIEKYFGVKWRNRMIITPDKTLVYGNILIDDKPVIKGIMKPSWTHIIFDQPYNINEDKPRIIKWNNWVDVIQSVLDK